MTPLIAANNMATRTLNQSTRLLFLLASLHARDRPEANTFIEPLQIIIHIFRLEIP
jgi:hypothetical protein